MCWGKRFNLLTIKWFEWNQKGFDFFMLEALCGNKNVQKILIFLFVNGKCYGAQLQRHLGTALTPIQKALLRLERGGLILSYYEGKTRLYQFNPGFPLLGELEQLLKKAYTLLPSNEKKDYYVAKEEYMTRQADQQKKIQVLLAFWEKLSGITRLTFHAKTKSKEERGWNGNGRGEVVVKKEGSNVLIFTEKGNWQEKQGGEAVSFSNVFRWTFDRAAGMISLENLRWNNPVFIFHLIPSSNSSLSSIDSHLYEEDTCFGKIHFDCYSLHLNLRIIGPRKNEEINYFYA